MVLRRGLRIAGAGLLLQRRGELGNGRGGEKRETGGKGEAGKAGFHADQLSRHLRTCKSDSCQTDVIRAVVLRARHPWRALKRRWVLLMT